MTKKTFKPRMKKVVLYFFIGFAILFIFRLIYGYSKTNDQFDHSTNSFDGISLNFRNIASKEYKWKESSGQSQEVAVDANQKYEKVASVKSKSTQFTDEEKAVRDKITDYKAIVQFEQKSGNDGARNLTLVVGVQPDRFEQLYAELVEIGTVLSKNITKTDKTNEFKQLNAKKASLMSIRESLIELKSKGGKIEEYIDLENRILDIESQLQNLGVQLGDFDEENEFCTIKYSLKEGKETKISLMHRVKVAFEWTVKLYFRLIATLVFILAASYLIILIVDKSKVIGAIRKNLD